MKNLFKISAIILVVFLASCNGNTPNPPYTYQTNPQYTWGFAEFYGDYYSNYDIEDNVLSINLFSDKLGISTSSNQLVGIGQYLVLEDVFVSPTDIFLSAGTYNAVDTIIDVKPFTFLRGKEFKENKTDDGQVSGSYIYYIEEDESKSVVKYITDGNFTVDIKNDTVYTIQCNFKTNDKKELKGTFTGVLHHYDRLQKVKAGTKRDKILKMSAVAKWRQ
ncbi:MAG: hypothetical protein QM751_03360 [Paludibacteraceae bacterium]